MMRFTDLKAGRTTYGLRYRITAVLLAAILTFEFLPAAFWASAEEKAEAEPPRMIEPYDDPPVSHTAGIGSEDDVRIVGESAENRSETSKQFVMSDGSVMVREYGFPVHYNADGEYLELDNRLVEASAKQAEHYENVRGYFDVKIAKKLNGKSKHLTVSKNGRSVSMGLKHSDKKPVKESTAKIKKGGIDRGAAKKARSAKAEISAGPDLQAAAIEKLESGLVYENVFEQTSIEYVITPTGVKENIVVKEKQESYEYAFSLEAPGLTAVKNGGALLFYENGEAVFRMPAMYMTDGAGAYSEAVDFTVTGEGGAYDLTVTADKEWINAAERVFPVVIDPIIDAWTTSAASGWTLNHNGTRSAPSGGRVFVSKSSYAAVRFPAAAMENMTLAYGSVRLNVKSFDGGFNALDYEIYAASTDSSFQNITGIGNLELEPTYVWAADAGSIVRSKWHDFYITEPSVKNDELILVFKNTNNEDIRAGISVSDSGYLPSLTLYYRNIQGFSDYPTESFEVEGAAARVNMINRKLSVAIDGLSVNTDFMPLQADLIYNQDFNAVFGELSVANYFGYRVKTNFNQYVRRDEHSDLYYHIGADGGVNTYLEDGASVGFYISEKTNLSLQVVGRSAKLFDDIGNEVEFMDGRLTTIRSENPLMGEIRVVYAQENGLDTDQIQSVGYYRYKAQLSSNEIQYKYNSSGLLTDLVSYYRGAGNALVEMGKRSFGYSAGNLTQVKNAAGQTRLSLSYTNGNLSSMRSSMGAGYAFTYENGKIDRVAQTQGVTAAKEYDSVRFTTYGNTVTAKYTRDGIEAGSRSTSADNHKRAVSDWYTDEAGNNTVTTDSLWRNSGNDPFWPNFSKSAYAFEEKLNTDFADSFDLSAYGSKTGAITSSVPDKPGNSYALSFRVKTAGSSNLTVRLGSQSKKVRTNGVTDGYVTVPFSRAASGTQLVFINDQGVSAEIKNVSFGPVIQTNVYKSLTGVMYAYRIYKDETIDLERKTVRTYREKRGIESIVETDNATGAVRKTTSYVYADDPAGRVGRLTGILETEDGKSSETTITNSRTDNSETVTTKTVKNSRTRQSTIEYTTGVDEYTKKVTDEKGVSTKYRYGLVHGDFRQTRVQLGTEIYDYEYNADGSVTKITDIYGNSQTLSYVNGAFGGGAHGPDSVYGIDYNDYMLPENVRYNGSALVGYQYNANGDLSRISYANGQTEELSYGGRQVYGATYKDSASDASPESIAYTRDSAGRITGKSLKEGTTQLLSYSYGGHDSKTFKSAVVNNPDESYTANYTYNFDDEKKRLTGESHSIAQNTYTVGYTYDDEDRLESVSSGKYKLEIEYEPGTDDDTERVAQTRTTYNGYHVLQHYYRYDYWDRATLKIESRKSGCHSQFDNPAASYDQLGRVKTLKNDDSVDRMFEYTYDNVGRLASEKRGYGQAAEYTYDESGNFERVEGGGVHDSYYYLNGRLTEFYNYTKEYRFAYDELGNPTEYKGNPLKWTRGRMLESGSQNGYNFSYKYDADNLRYEKTVDGETTQYYYNGGVLQAEQRGATFIYYFYGLEGVAGMVYNGQYYFYEKNLLGDVIGIYNASGTLMASYDYDAWGNVIAKSGTMADINPFRYRSYYMDRETGFYYLNTRYYDPEIRRFVNADNYELLAELSGIYGQINMYNYCNNNPIMFTDPNGMYSIKQFFIDSGKMIGGLALALVSGSMSVLSAPLALIPGLATLQQTLLTLSIYGGVVTTSIFDSTVNNDMNLINWNPFNSNYIATGKSQKVSFYNGVAVFRTNTNGSAGIPGMIFFMLGESADWLKHEYGHVQQARVLGALLWAGIIAIPSAISFSTNPNQHSGRWFERWADIWGNYP